MSQSTTTSSATAAYRAARDQLLGLRGDPRQAVEVFRWPELGATFNWAVDWFDVVARERPDSSALVVVEEDGRRVALTYEQMSRRSNQVARWLARVGVGPGDRVLVMLGNQVELWESMLAIMKLGAVIMPTTTALGPTDLADRLARTGGRYVLVDAASQPKVDALAEGPTAWVGTDLTRVLIGGGGGDAPPAGWLRYEDAYAEEAVELPHPGTAPSDALLLYFTSGTTSKPKLVEHTQISYPVGHLTTMYWLGLRPGDVHLNISSPGWAKHAWSSFFAPWIAEATIVVYNYARFDAAALLARLRTEGVSTFCAPPTVWRMLIQADLSAGKPPELRELAAAGEPLNPEVIEQVRAAWDVTIRDGFGQTEMTLAIGNPPGPAVKLGSMGRALPGYPVVVVDPLTGTVNAGEGEICLDLRAGRPLPLMTGYADDPERNAEANAGGYFHTGDVASQAEDGSITFIGRTDDVFKASDYKISPFELESVLIEHPAVAEAAVVPAPDAVRLAVPKAYVTLAAGHEPSRDTALSILRYAREHLSPFQRVRRVEFAELPKTISGKIRRVDLRQQEQDRADAGTPGTEWRDDQFPELKAPGGEGPRRAGCCKDERPTEG